MDVSGEHQLDVEHNLYKRRVDKEGNVIEEDKVAEMGDHMEKAVEGMNATLGEDGKHDAARCESCYGAETPELKSVAAQLFLQFDSNQPPSTLAAAVREQQLRAFSFRVCDRTLPRLLLK
jgi:hypothetical protein